MRANIHERRAYIKRLLENEAPIDTRELAKMWQSSPASITADIAACRGQKDPYYRPVHPVDAQNQRARRIGVNGILTKGGWKDTLESHGYSCAACGSKDNIVIDHIIPLSKGGTNTDDNIQPLCSSCNTTKSNRVIDIPTLRQMIARRIDA